MLFVVIVGVVVVDEDGINNVCCVGKVGTCGTINLGLFTGVWNLGMVCGNAVAAPEYKLKLYIC